LAAVPVLWKLSVPRFREIGRSRPASQAAA
jgi:hypothetical protein